MADTAPLIFLAKLGPLEFLRLNANEELYREASKAVGESNLLSEEVQ